MLHAAIRRHVRWHCLVGEMALSRRAKLIDVQFTQMVSDPKTALRGVVAALGVRLSDAALARAAAASASPSYQNGQLLPPTPHGALPGRTRGGRGSALSQAQSVPFWDAIGAGEAAALSNALVATYEEEVHAVAAAASAVGATPRTEEGGGGGGGEQARLGACRPLNTAEIPRECTTFLTCHR